MRSLRLAAFVAAFAGIALLATGAASWHVDSPGSVDACPICCHVAHINAVPGALAAALAAPVHVAWVLTGRKASFLRRPFRRNSALSSSARLGINKRPGRPVFAQILFLSLPTR